MNSLPRQFWNCGDSVVANVLGDAAILVVAFILGAAVTFIVAAYLEAVVEPEAWSLQSTLLPRL